MRLFNLLLSPLSSPSLPFYLSILYTYTRISLTSGCTGIYSRQSRASHTMHPHNAASCDLRHRSAFVSSRSILCALSPYLFIKLFVYGTVIWFRFLDSLFYPNLLYLHDSLKLSISRGKFLQNNSFFTQ